MKYGTLPKSLGEHIIDCQEMMFYQYLCIKLIGQHQPIAEDRLKPFFSVIGAACCDFIGEFGLDKYMNSYIYVSAKNLFQSESCPYNRPGWHSDGFMTDDINYLWSNKNPTIFNTSEFALTQDDSLSLKEMELQANSLNNFLFSDNQLLRLDQFNIHKVNDNQEKGMRSFLKISFSKDKYNLIGNSINHELAYDWSMKPRKMERNIPQSIN